MKAGHVEAERTNARAVLAACSIGLGQDFYTLHRWQITDLLVQADMARYRKPKAANGSRARYFHELMQRRAKGS